jgi:hypothetical protein
MAKFDDDLIFKIDKNWFWRKDDHNHWVEIYNFSHRHIINFLTNLGYEKKDSYTTDHIYAYRNLSFSL